MFKTLAKLGVATLVVLLSVGASCGGGGNPGPVPTPTPTPPVAAIKYPELLLRTDGVRLIRPNSPEPFVPFGVVSCCMPFFDAAGNEINVLWPGFSEAFVDHTGANMFHFRMGPFYGDSEHEGQWKDIGGPYAGGPGSAWNPAFWDKLVQVVDYAGKKGANVEINVIDTWYCKRSNSDWGDQQMPWPQADIDACGRFGTAEQEKFLRKTVSTLNDYANVIWITDNEGGEIRQTKLAWYEWVASIIRDEEQKGQFKVVRLIGTNNTDFAGSPAFNYVATHDRAALTAPLAGKHTSNNERNPQFPVEQEFANYCRAQAAGLHYWFWRAEIPIEDAEWLLAKMREGCGGGPVGCFPPASDDPKWGTPTSGAVGTNMRPAVEAAKDVVGSRCGTDHQGSLVTIDLLGAEMRKKGYCAGRLDDALFVKTPEGRYQEFHVVSFASGCYSLDSAQLPKYTWPYAGESAACSITPPVVDELLCKEHQATNHIWDCTPKANGEAILPEGHPERAACEAVACGGTPSYAMASGVLSITPRDNPYQFKVNGTGTDELNCFCPRAGGTDLCRNTPVTQ